MVNFRLLKLFDGFFLFSDFLFVLWNLVDNLIQLLFRFQEFSSDFSRTYLRIKQLCVFLFDLLDILLVLDLQLMKVNKLELIAHLLFLGNQVGSFGNLCSQWALFVLILFNEGSFLSVFLFEVSLNSFGLDVTSSTVLPTHENLSLEIVCVFSDFSNCHISLLENSLRDNVEKVPSKFQE